MAVGLATCNVCDGMNTHGITYRVGNARSAKGELDLDSHCNRVDSWPVVPSQHCSAHKLHGMCCSTNSKVRLLHLLSGKDHECCLSVPQKAEREAAAAAAVPKAGADDKGKAPATSQVCLCLH